MKATSRLLVLAIAAIGLFSTSCVTQEGHRRAMADREERILALQEERARLKGDLAAQEAHIDALNAQLSEANTRVVPEPIPAAAKQQDAFPELDALGVGYGLRDGHMVISIPSSISFPSGKAVLSSDGKRALREVADTLKRKYPDGYFHIEGHTDSDPIKKAKFASNRDLSIARAMAVLTYLVEDCTIEDEQCVVVGHGQYRNVASNDSKSNKALNRRVEIVVHGR